MRHATRGLICHRAEGVATIELLLAAALLILFCLALYAMSPLWRWEKRR